jgi:hypothetical protein
LLLFVLSLHAQRFRVTLKTDQVIHANNVFITEPLFRKMPNVILGDEKIRLDAIREIHDSSLLITYKTTHFRGRIFMVRQLEKGKICLYDFHTPDSRESANVHRISSNNRFYYHLPGDTILSVLNRKNYDTLFNSEFASRYPAFQTTKKKYLRLHTTGILSSVMLPNLITVTGFQSVAFLSSYLATTTYFTGASLINRQKKFNQVRKMVKEYNAQTLD